MTTEAGKRHRHYWRLDDGCACGEWMPGTDEWAQASRDRAIEAEAVAAERARLAPYLDHRVGCPGHHKPLSSGSCTCGLLAIIEEKP